MPVYGEPFALDPKRAALLVVDIQNDFVRAGGPQEVRQARFHETRLETVLRALGVSQLVVTGTVTQICVEETGRRTCWLRCHGQPPPHR